MTNDMPLNLDTMDAAKDVYADLQDLDGSEPSISTRLSSSYHPLRTFDLPKGAEKHYQQQYADLYFLRLAQLKSVVESIAVEAWADFSIAGEKAQRVERVLDVRQGDLSWVVGTVYMEMPLKPNILDDISKEHWIAAPPAREKFFGPDGAGGEVMLEDESGRLKLTGQHLSTQLLVTGCIIAALGTENASGEFEVIDSKVADLPRQPERWELEDSDAALDSTNKRKKATNGDNRQTGGKIAILSGLEITGSAGDNLLLDDLRAYLLGATDSCSTSITRLIIAGNSMAHSSPIPSREEAAAAKKLHGKRYGYDATSYNALPSESLDLFLASLLPSLPITLLPGASDPANVAIPQQPLHPALFPHSRAYATTIAEKESEDAGQTSWFDSVSNPWQGEVDGWRFLGNGGQPIDDIYHYVEGDARLEMMEGVLRWRVSAPTAPDTLWCYPFQDDDPMLIRDCPHVYFVGNQPRFETAVIEGPTGQQVRLVAVPKFRETGKIVLLDCDTLEAEYVELAIASKD